MGIRRAPAVGHALGGQLNTGDYVADPARGISDLVARGLRNTGTRTRRPDRHRRRAVFHRATNFDKKLRASDKRTGEMRGRRRWPFAGNAHGDVRTAGAKFVVIAAGGESRAERREESIAFALPKP